MLRWLKQVMASVPAEDTALVDLYTARGGADPLVVACALDGAEQETSFLDPQEWAIVTGDNAVSERAAVFGVRALSNSEFAELVDSQSSV